MKTASAQPVRRAHMFGVPLDLLTMEETLALIRQAMRDQRRLHHVALNVGKLIHVQDDEELRRDVIESDIVGVDGMGVVWGARLLGLPVPERVAGVDLMYAVLEMCAREGFRPYFFGARQDVLDNALDNARRIWPTLKIAGARHGYFNAEDETDIVKGIQNADADCLFVAISTPIKERFCRRYRDDLGVSFVMGVGGSFDILAGRTSRAPRLFQKRGMEWAYRLACEPRRMWRRYLFTNIAFARLMAGALIRRPHPAIETRVL